MARRWGQLAIVAAAAAALLGLPAAASAVAPEQVSGALPKQRALTAGFPSGRTGTYRRLDDYDRELRELAAAHPGIVRHFTLPEKSWEGRSVNGIEIGPRSARRKGKPSFVMFGLHHAREWPSGEHTIEWAHEVVNGWVSGDKRARNLLRRARVVVVPVVNPDGFNASREYGELLGSGGGRNESGVTEIVNIVSHVNEYRRKNCRLLGDPEFGTCLQPALGLFGLGVDLNRNYSGFWGGPGNSTFFADADYRGPKPFSEPESRNVQHLLSREQATVMITNHTVAGLILRPPGLAAAGDPPDEKIYKRLGAKMAAENGYANQKGFQLYDTTGTTEDWSYFATGGLGYTFEIGTLGFHPEYDATIAEWTGDTPLAGRGKGNRAAFYHAWRFAGNKKHHSVIKGRAPGKVKRIRIHKSFVTESSPLIGGPNEGEVLEVPDTLSTTYRVRGGRFRAETNPSTRPIVRGGGGRKPDGPPSAPIEFSGGPGTAVACADFDTEDETCFNDHAFRVPKSKKRDNDSAVVRIQWPSPVSDWDMKVYRDSDGDGSSAGEGPDVAQSGEAPSTSEQATVADLKRGERYVIRVINYAATEPYTGRVSFFGPPAPSRPNKTERWKLTCLGKGGKVLGKSKVVVDRGEVRQVDLRERCR